MMNHIKIAEYNLLPKREYVMILSYFSTSTYTLYIYIYIYDNDVNSYKVEKGLPNVLKNDVHPVIFAMRFFIITS